MTPKAFVCGLTVSWRNAVIHKTDLAGAVPALPTQQSLSHSQHEKLGNKGKGKAMVDMMKLK